MIKVVVDCFGGDRSPQANVKGAINALNDNQDLYLILTGDEEKLQNELSQYKYDKTR